MGAAEKQKGEGILLVIVYNQAPRYAAPYVFEEWVAVERDPGRESKKDKG